MTLQGRLRQLECQQAAAKDAEEEGLQRRYNSIPAADKAFIDELGRRYGIDGRNVELTEDERRRFHRICEHYKGHRLAWD